MEVYAKEVIRCRDVYLFKFDCICGEELLSGFELGKCSICAADHTSSVLDLTKVTAKRNLISIPDEKRRKGIGKKVVRSILESQDFRCQYCTFNFRERIDCIHIDHVLPLSAGGTNNISNLVAACSKCNLLASNKVFRSIWDKTNYILGKRK